MENSVLSNAVNGFFVGVGDGDGDGIIGIAVTWSVAIACNFFRYDDKQRMVLVSGIACRSNHSIHSF